MEGVIVFIQQGDLWRINADGSGLQQLTASGGVGFPAISPAGDVVAFSREGDLWTIEIDGSNPAQLTATGSVSEQSPEWSPDGSHIIYDDFSDGLEIIQYPGGNVVATYDPAGQQFWPSWSPADPNLIAFVTNAGGSRQIATIRLDETGAFDASSETIITSELGGEFTEPNFGPGGNLAVLGLGDNSGVWLMDADGSNASKLTTLFGAANFSPDGTHLAVGSNGGTTLHIVTVADGSSSMLHEGSGIFRPDWGPADAEEAVADLEVSLSSDPDGAVESPETPAVAGEAIVYTITVDNLGPSDNAGYTVAFGVPTGTSFKASSESCTLADTTVTCASDGITEAGGPQTFDITLDIDSGYVIANDGAEPDNQANLSATASLATTETTDDNPENNSDTHDVTVIGVADLEVTQTAKIHDALAVPTDAGIPISGNFNFVTYEETVTNNGPSDADDVVVSLDLPAELDASTAEVCLGTLTTCDSEDFGPYVESTALGLGDIEAGASVNLVFKANVEQALRDGPFPSGDATVVVSSPVTDDPDPANNTDQDMVTIFTVADPPDLTTAEPGNAEIGLQWGEGDDTDGDADGGSDITGYDIIVDPDDGDPFSVFVSKETASTSVAGRFSFIVTGLTNDTTYAVTIKSRNGAGDSDSSNTLNATPCPDCVVEFIPDGEVLTIVTTGDTEGAGLDASILQADLSCEELLSQLGLGATGANPIVVCDEYPSDETAGNGGLIASLREEPATEGACGTLTCIADTQYTSNVPFTIDNFLREVVILDKSITPGDWDPSVFVDGELIGSSDRATWCDAVAPDFPANGCVEEIVVLNPHTAPNGRDGVGDVMAVIRFFVNPSKGIG